MSEQYGDASGKSDTQKTSDFHLRERERAAAELENLPGSLGELAVDAPTVEDLDHASRDKAERMREAAGSFFSRAAEVEMSGEPGAVELAKHLRERGSEAVEKAIADYEEETRSYRGAKDFVIGRLLGVASGEMPVHKGSAVFLLATSGETVDFSEMGLNKRQIDQLYHDIYSLLGVEEPTDEEFMNNKSKLGSRQLWTRVNSVSGDTGLILVEDRKYAKTGRVGRREYQETYRGLYLAPAGDNETRHNQNA